MASELIISEVFGPTVQGEGPSAGTRCAFVRLGRCNLDCSWCDTPYTWDWGGKNGTAYSPSVELERMTPENVHAQVNKLDVSKVVVSGGEPLLQRESLTLLCKLLLEDGYNVEIETNGTRPPLDPYLHSLIGALRYNVSPKLPSSGVDERKAWVPDALRALIGSNAVFKFVIGSEDDVRAVRVFLQRFPDLAVQRVWLMPEGRTANEVVARFDGVAELAIDLGCNVTTRLHVLAWGTERGR